MAGEAGSGYLCDVPYPRQFVASIAPPTLRLVAALNGVACPAEDDFDYLELGSANGDTLSVLAAANPDARFYGVDLNPEHIAFAEGLAERARLDNVRYIGRDLASMADLDLPPLDFVVAHGFLTWVSPEVTDALLSFAAARLKPGGLLYVSYNALPGWASIEPLRRMMLDHTAGMGGSSVDRAREGLAFLRRLADSGAGYFAQHPTARQMLSLMQTAGIAYVLHEYFNSDFHPMYFADVARRFAARGFGFVGQVPLYLNVRELATPPQVRKLAEGTEDRVAFESLKDFAAQEMFRSDVYAKAAPGARPGQVTRSTEEMRLYFEGTSFGTMAPAAQIKREVKLPFYTLDYKGPVYDALLGALADAPATAMELAQRKELAQLGQLRIGDCLRNLVLGGQVVPMRAGARVPASVKGPVRLGGPNRVALFDALHADGPLVLAAPATGSGVHVSLLEGLALWLLSEVPADAHAAWLRDYAARRGTPLVVGERTIKDDAELVKIMPREVDKLRALLPKLVALGVVEAGAGEPVAPRGRVGLSSAPAMPPAPLPARPRAASVTTMTEYVLPQHSNVFGGVFGGQIMAWVDLCAAICAQRHSGRQAVTAFIDDLKFHEPVRVGEVVRLVATLSATFRTSMEIAVEVTGEDSRTGRTWPCVRAMTVFVAIGDDGRPTPVPSLLLDDEASRASQAAGEARRRDRLAR